MSPENQQHFEDLIVKAIQSGKQETSGLVDSIIKKIEKIHKILEKQNETMESFHTKVETHIVNDTKWKEKAEPIIQMGENLKGASKVMIYFSGLIITVGGAGMLIINFFKK